MELPLPMPLLMDGATGTQLQQRGMPSGVCTERWALEHPNILLEIQRAYVAAGSHLILTPTLCANRAALTRHGLEDQVEEYNRRLTALTLEAANGKVLVAGDLGPTGLRIPPCGETSFEALVDIYAQQAEALAVAGVDLFVAETLLSMAEARAAVLGIRRVSSKPIMVTCWCNEEGRMSSDTDVLACGIVMQGMGVAAFGVNCVTPEVAEAQLNRMVPYLTIPLIAKPNAGLPQNGGYAFTAEHFANSMSGLAIAGARIFGGCCGTGPEHITALSQTMIPLNLTGLPEISRDPDVIPCASEKEARFITPDVDVGKAISCSPDLLEDILEAEEDSPCGALKIEVLDEDDLDLFAGEQYAIRDALCLWSDVPDLLEAALRAYQGRAFYDGTAGLEPEVLERLGQMYGLIVL